MGEEWERCLFTREDSEQNRGSRGLHFQAFSARRRRSRSWGISPATSLPIFFVSVSFLLSLDIYLPSRLEN